MENIVMQDGKEEILIVPTKERGQVKSEQKSTDDFEKIYKLFKEFRNGLGEEVPQEVAFEMFMGNMNGKAGGSMGL